MDAAADAAAFAAAGVAIVIGCCHDRFRHYYHSALLAPVGCHVPCEKHVLV